MLCILSSCGPAREMAVPVVEFTKLPPMGEGSPDKLDAIEGRVAGAQPGQRVVVFARSGVWWVQPTAAYPFSEIQPDKTWKNVTHPGSAYAAVLATADYRPPITTTSLPEPGGDIVAVTVADESKLVRPAVKTMAFGGYQWERREISSDRGGTKNVYDPENVWIDRNGYLHLRIAKTETSWTSAEVRLTHSLGYGTYSFVTRDIAHLEPAAVFSLFTWDEAGPPREMNIEISRWGETVGKNAQFVIQPYYVPANAIRFTAPAGVLTHSLRWEPGRIQFKTVRGATVVAEHAFTSGVPSPGSESVHINHFVYGNKSNPLKRGSEVIVEKFEYLP